MTDSGTLTLGLNSLTNNADLYLLNSAGTVLKSSLKTGTNAESISSVLAKGIYYVKVTPGTGVVAAGYTLDHNISYSGDTNDKAGNTLKTAKTVDAQTQSGWVGLGDNDDYYRFDLASSVTGGILRLHDLTGGNADLSLYNVAGTLLQRSNKTGALEDSITSNLAAGTYFARVNAVSGNIDYKLDFDKKYVPAMLAS